VAFASGALIAVFFLPAWKIWLFAPQYPDGLVMNIWVNDITGDVDIINGLNHYIGMKHITVDMFPEFKYLPYVVGFFMLLGMAVAISGNRKFLFVYVALTIIGGALAVYDFWQWAYDYGHNLDPKAPIQVAGLSYQPPIFGHKRLLNFDAYSYPAVAGWIVIAAGSLAAAVWFVEWWRHRKALRNPGAVKLASVVIIALLFSACKAKPEPFAVGKDSCGFCKMSISDLRYGGEIVTKKGRVYKFDDLHCQVRFLKSGAVAENEIAQTLAIDFEKPNEFIDVNTAGFFVGGSVKSPMGSNAAAFSSKEDAAKFGASNTGEIIDWQALLAKFNN
jgi:copper chaperone NosL